MQAETDQKEVLDEIGKAYNKSGVQFLLIYQIERGVVVIPKSHNREELIPLSNLLFGGGIRER